MLAHSLFHFSHRHNSETDCAASQASRHTNKADLTLTGRAGPAKSTITCERVALGKYSKIITHMALWRRERERGKESVTGCEF